MKDSREDVNLKQMRSVASKESAKTYEYYTPKKIVEMMARILDADTDEIYDPCCGSGAMLLTAASMLCQKDVSLYGQTKEKSSYTLCKMNAFLRDRQVDLGNYSKNTLKEDVHKGRRFKSILANPPFNAAGWMEELEPYDLRLPYGFPPDSNANYVWLQVILEHLADDGCACVLMPNGSLTTKNSREQPIRCGFLYDRLVEAIIELPEGVFVGTKISCCLWALRKNRKEDTVLFADASKFDLKGKTDHAEADLNKLIDTVQRYRAGQLPRQGDWYAIASLEEIKHKDYNLSPNFYLPLPDIAIEPIRENRKNFIVQLDWLCDRIEDETLVKCLRQWKEDPLPRYRNRILLGEACRITGGMTPPDRTEGDVMAADVKTVIRHLFLPDDLPARMKVFPSEIQKYRICKEDIFINRSSETKAQLGCGCIAMKDMKAVFGSYFKRLRVVSKELLPLYLAAYMRSAVYRREIERVSPAYTARVNLNRESLSAIYIYYPAMAGQERIAETLRAVHDFSERTEDGGSRDALKQFVALFIEQCITYPILCGQRGGDL